ncbi:glycosyltransferase family 4 protein [Eggerthellaceae bacterium zg-997]|nr:glycosyltransferase family 4 protein [Eggerthellaceae bacterium zg-997]
MTVGASDRAVRGATPIAEGHVAADSLRPVRVLCVSAQKPDSTGSGVYLARTVDALAALGCEVAVVAGVDSRDRNRLGHKLYPVRFNSDELLFDVVGMSDTMPYPSTRYRDLTPAMLEAFYGAFERTLRTAVDEFDPDLVICHHLYLVTALATRMGLNRPVVGVCHNTCLRQLSMHDLERDRVAEGVRALDRICALHGEQRLAIAQRFDLPVARIEVVGTGFDSRVFRQDRRVPRKQGRVVYVGKIARKKGVMSLLHSLQKTKVGISELVLVGGSGSVAERIEARALAESCPFPVTFTGPLPPAKVAQAYRGSAVFVLPSFYEGLPLVMLEALACGCHVVCTDLPGVRPWLNAALGVEAPARFVPAPAMAEVDEPCEDALPLFEDGLREALRLSLRDAREPFPRLDLSMLTWEGVAMRLLGPFADQVIAVARARRTGTLS